MVAESGTGHEAEPIARSAEFSGDVAIEKVAGRKLSTRQDWHVTADRLRLVPAKPLRGACEPIPHSFIASAFGHVQLISASEIVKAEAMSFNLPQEH